MNKDVKTKEKLEEIEKNYNDLVNDEIKYAIVTAIQYYSSLNLKKLSELIGKPETTTIRYIKKLLEEELIIIDVEKTATSWGKFYRLSDYVLELLAKRDIEIDNRINWVQEETSKIDLENEDEVRDFFLRAILSKENLSYDAKSSQQGLSLSYNIQKMIVNEFITKVELLYDLLKNKGEEYLLEKISVKPSDIEMYNLTLKVHSMKQLMKLIEIQYNTTKEIELLKHEFEEEAKMKNIPEDQQQLFYFYSFLGSMEFNYTYKEDD